MDNNTKVIFVHVPKAAGGSIHTWLRDNSQNNNFTYGTGHKTLNEIREEFGREDFNFACIRNTYDRMISMYVFSRHKINGKLRKSYQRNNKEAIIRFETELEHMNKGIVHYIEWAYENIPIVTNPLSYWLDGVDIVLNHENLKEEFKVIQEKLNCFEPLPTHAHKMDYDPKDFYSTEYKKLIQKLYDEELERYKYSPKF